MSNVWAMCGQCVGNVEAMCGQCGATCNTFVPERAVGGSVEQVWFVVRLNSSKEHKCGGIRELVYDQLRNYHHRWCLSYSAVYLNRSREKICSKMKP